ncbi:MAG: sensor histidine kinase [Proteobacteria bacterium]|nr:sensor histidine kinase [Pseudomonadota bacterium]
MGGEGNILTLRQWFYRNARLPLLVSILTIVAVETLLLGIIGKNQFEIQEGVANRLAELSGLALVQKSTPLLQTGFDIAVRELRASRAFVCERGMIYALKTPEISSCSVENRFGYRILRIPLREKKQFEFVLQVPILPQESLIYYTLAFSVFVCVLGMLLLHRVGVRLEKDLFIPFFRNFSNQLHLPIKELESLRRKLNQLNELRTKEAVATAVMVRNHQVAHDIKSPLTALLFASKDFELLPNTSRQVIRSAVERISAIADSLTDSKSNRDKNSQQKLHRLIREMVAEKKVEYRELSHVVWKEDIDHLRQDTSAPFDPEEMKRILSNLINNAVEALDGGEGTIQVGAQNNQSSLQVWVQDSGKGFPPDLISKIGQPGLSRGKQTGQGLGLSHAHQMMTSRKGTIQVNAVAQGGTKVVLSF